nr:MAG TPA: PhoH-like protein [Caudoviricetes sp.]
MKDTYNIFILLVLFIFIKTFKSIDSMHVLIDKQYSKVFLLQYLILYRKRAGIIMNNRHSGSNKDSGGAFYVDDKILGRAYSKLDVYQKEYYHSIMDKNLKFIGINSPAGTGKTYIGIMAALEMLRQGCMNHVYYIRIPDLRSLKLGFLPGSELEKESIYFRPFYDICEDLGLRPEDVDYGRNNQSFILCTDIGLRGTNIEKSVVIVDEAQNGDLSSLKLILTRIHDDCKVILAGHSAQRDTKNTNGAFEKYIKYMCEKKWAKECVLTKNYRGELATYADQFEI